MYGAIPPRKLNFSTVSVHRLSANTDMTHFQSITSTNNTKDIIIPAATFLQRIICPGFPYTKEIKSAIQV